MNHDELLLALKSLAMRTNIDATAGEAKWYLFGSVQKRLPNSADIDIVVLCRTHDMADAIRQKVGVDQFSRPIHLCIFTQEEEMEIRFIEKQDCIQIF